MNTDFIKQKISFLKSHDAGFARFGADKHRYENIPVSIDEIKVFEEKFEITLPATYKQFLLEIGYGAGPYYGIWSLTETIKEIEISIDELKKENIEISPSKPFPFKQKDLENVQIKINNGEKSDLSKIPPLQGTFPVSGCIPICFQGCTYWNYLVVTGDFRGSVWDAANFEGSEGYWIPSSFSADLISFEEWIMKCLLNELSIFKKAENEEAYFKNNKSNLIQRIFSKILKNN